MSILRSRPPSLPISNADPSPPSRCRPLTPFQMQTPHPLPDADPPPPSRCRPPTPFQMLTPHRLRHSHAAPSPLLGPTIVFLHIIGIYIGIGTGIKPCSHVTCFNPFVMAAPLIFIHFATSCVEFIQPILKQVRKNSAKMLRAILTRQSGLSCFRP